VGNNIFQELKVPPGQTVTTYQAFCIALAALLLMVLSLVASRLASDLIIGGPSLGVGTGISTTASAVNATTAVATATGEKSVAALKSVKSAAAVPVKGVTFAVSAGTAALRKMAGGISVNHGAGSGSTVAGSATTAAKSASSVPGSNIAAKGTNDPTKNGGTPT
jgi:type IV secretory pathway TrbL component